MLDKIEVRVPYGAGFVPGFRLLSGAVNYQGTSTVLRRAQHYAGTCDLRAFGIEAILHVNYKRGRGQQNHKLELLGTGKKSLRQASNSIQRVFDIDPDSLDLMRIDFASDLHGVPVSMAYGSTRVRFKRSADSIGELDYETVGSRKLEYFRYGKAPNCFRVYDKPAECLARFNALLKQSNPDAEPPSFEDLFGFPPDAILTRFERQTGAKGIPSELARFGDLRNAAEFNPFSRVDIIPDAFPFPDPKVVGVAHSLKLAGIRCFIDRYGFQQARATLNVDRNAKRSFDEYREYLDKCRAESPLTIERIVESYRVSVTRQIEGKIAA